MFESDPAESSGNRVKHGIDFDDARLLWLDQRLLVIAARHSGGDERRWLAIGVIEDSHWSAVYTYRGAAIRLISVRRARKEEVDIYERSEL